MAKQGDGWLKLVARMLARQQIYKTIYFIIVFYTEPILLTVGVLYYAFVVTIYCKQLLGVLYSTCSVHFSLPFIT